jgi:hypothetical protein
VIPARAREDRRGGTVFKRLEKEEHEGYEEHEEGQRQLHVKDGPA